MGATHALKVHTVSGIRVSLDIEIVDEQEHVIPIVKTALLSMLYGSLDLRGGHKVADEVRRAYDDAGGDEPEDARAASAILRAVGTPVVLDGDVAKRTRKALYFKGGGRVRVDIELRDESLGRHLVAGATWKTAPLFDG